MTMYDAITGTIMQITGIIPCRAAGYTVKVHHRRQVNNNTDSHLFVVQDGYGDTYRIVFRVIIDDNGEITRFKPLFATVVQEVI